MIPAHHPSSDWADGFAAAARATADSGRGAVLVVPDQRDLARLRAACTRVLGRTGFVELTAEAGPAARYRAFLAALRGDVRVVIGNRAAAYAPVRDLGLVAAVGRRRRPAGRAAGALPAHPDGAGAAGDPAAERGAGRRLRAQLRGRAVGAAGVAARAGRRPDADPAHRAPGAGGRRLRPRPGPRSGGPVGPAAARGVRAGPGQPAAGAGADPGAARRATWWPWSARTAGSRLGAGAATDRSASSTGPGALGRPRLRLVRAAAPRLGVPDLREPVAPGAGGRRRSDGGGARARLPQHRDPAVRRRRGAAGGAEHPRPRGGHPGGRAGGRRRVRGCRAAGHRPAAAPGRPAGLRGGAASLAGRGRAGPLGRRRGLGDRGGGQRGPGRCRPWSGWIRPASRPASSPNGPRRTSRRRPRWSPWTAPPRPSPTWSTCSGRPSRSRSSGRCRCRARRWPGPRTRSSGSRCGPRRAPGPRWCAPSRT